MFVLLLVLVLVLDSVTSFFFLNALVEAFHQFAKHRDNAEQHTYAFDNPFAAQSCFATSASKPAAHSVADPRASSKNRARVWSCLRPFPSAVSKTDRLARSSWSITSAVRAPTADCFTLARRGVSQAIEASSN